VSVAFRRESDEEHLEPKFELPLPAGPNYVTPRGLRLIEARIAALAGQDDDVAKREARYWKTRRATAQLAPPPPPGEIAIGARVTLRLNGADRTIDIVGHDEADAGAGRVPFAAPLAVALIGAEVGERIDFNGKAEAIEVLRVELIPDER
jgi:transcription elongation GreA/GreB family factor